MFAKNFNFLSQTKNVFLLSKTVSASTLYSLASTNQLVSFVVCALIFVYVLDGTHGIKINFIITINILSLEKKVPTNKHRLPIDTHWYGLFHVYDSKIRIMTTQSNKRLNFIISAQLIFVVFSSFSVERVNQFVLLSKKSEVWITLPL